MHLPHSVLFVERINFPISVSCWVFKEPGNVLEGSPFLCKVSGLFSLILRDNDSDKLTTNLPNSPSVSLASDLRVERVDLTFQSFQLFHGC